MIYILSGTAKSGKTTIAKEFTKRYLIPYFSTDYIMMMLHRGNPNLKIDTEAKDSIVAAQIEPYVYGMIKTMIENKVTYLIEGVHFNPDFVSKLKKEYPRDITALYLGFKDTSVSLKLRELNKYKDRLENSWFSSFSNEKMIELVKYLIQESKHTFDLCKSLALPYLEVYDLNSQMEDILKELKQ